MKIAITAQGSDLNAPTSPRFGRCPTFILVETETMAFEALPNPATSSSGGAGIQAAQFLAERGVQALLTANVGPNAMEVLQAAEIPVYGIEIETEMEMGMGMEMEIDGGTVRETVEAYRAGKLERVSGANVPAHAGVGRARARHDVGPTPREQEIADLKSKAADLRKQLAEIIDRIEQLEKEN